MTDLEKFVELYRSLGIECKVNIVDMDKRFGDVKKYDKYIVLGGYERDATEDSRFNGYSGFYTDIIFDKDGKFKSQGFWE